MEEEFRSGSSEPSAEERDEGIRLQVPSTPVTTVCRDMDSDFYGDGMVNWSTSRQTTWSDGAAEKDDSVSSWPQGCEYESDEEGTSGKEKTCVTSATSAGKSRKRILSGLEPRIQTQVRSQASTSTPVNCSQRSVRNTSGVLDAVMRTKDEESSASCIRKRADGHHPNTAKHKQRVPVPGDNAFGTKRRMPRLTMAELGTELDLLNGDRKLRGPRCADQKKIERRRERRDKRTRRRLASAGERLEAFVRQRAHLDMNALCKALENEKSLHLPR